VEKNVWEENMTISLLQIYGQTGRADKLLTTRTRFEYLILSIISNSTDQLQRIFRVKLSEIIVWRTESVGEGSGSGLFGAVIIAVSRKDQGKSQES
jgi:hypothetical protein